MLKIGTTYLLVFLLFPFGPTAQTLPIDNSFTVQAHFKPMEISGQDRYFLVTYTKFVAMGRKLGICGAYFGITDPSNISKGSVFLGDKRVKSNLSKFRILTNEKRFLKKRSDDKLFGNFFLDFTQTKSIEPVKGLVANCVKTKKRFKEEYLAISPRIQMPSN